MKELILNWKKDDSLELPRISIVIPVLNGSKHIDNLIKSLINLDFPENKYEILIVDNGSRDRTLEIIRHHQLTSSQIKLFFEKIESSYAARNTGVRNATGEIIAFTDVDCVVDKNWLINIAKSFSENSISCVAGKIISGKGQSIVERYSAKIDILSQKNTLNSEFLPYPQTANAAYKKDIFNKIGCFDEKLTSGGDADFAWRMQLETDSRILYVPNAIVIHEHRTNIKGLFKQNFRYGYGSVGLYKKYKKYMDLKNKKKSINYINIPILVLKFFKQICEYTYYSISKNVDDLQFFEPLLFFVFNIGYKLGRIYGSIRLKIFYI